MYPSLNRRKVLALGVAGVTALGGCQTATLSGSQISIRIAVTNTLDRREEIWVQLTRENGSDPVGESVMMDPNSSTVLKFEVPAGTYRFTASVDDLSRAPKRQLQWEITDESCSTTVVVTLAGGVEEPEMVVETGSCDSL